MDKVGDKVDSPSSKCGVQSAECGMVESLTPLLANSISESRPTLPVLRQRYSGGQSSEGEGAPPSRLGLTARCAG
jgi:hypothetical protein